MTSHQVFLIQKSWAGVVPIQDTAAGLFYQRLFVLEPGIRPLFGVDMKAQGRRLMIMLGVIVNSLTDIDQLAPVAQDLARSLAGYDVKPAYVDAAGAALLWTLEQGLGSIFSEETRDAWAAAYSKLARTMLEAATIPA